jgi:ATP-dependent 26S proteasome regulatory subunit
MILVKMRVCSVLVCAGAAAVSGGGGYGRLGGIQQYSKVLRELVMLPLQLPELFAR